MIFHTSARSGFSRSSFQGWFTAPGNVATAHLRPGRTRELLRRARVHQQGAGARHRRPYLIETRPPAGLKAFGLECLALEPCASDSAG